MAVSTGKGPEQGQSFKCRIFCQISSENTHSMLILLYMRKNRKIVADAYYRVQICRRN
jgi:hypothetical protein